MDLNQPGRGSTFLALSKDAAGLLTLVDLLHLDRLLDIKSIKALGNVHSKLIQPNTLP